MLKQTWKTTSYPSNYKKRTICTKVNILFSIFLIFGFIVLYLQYYHVDNSIKTIISNVPSLKVTGSNRTVTFSNVYTNISKELVIVVQVHNRDMYLTHLIDSLRNAAGIETVLLIFSHDYYDEKLNKLIAKIDFCSYKQIYYPYSVQNHTNSFPGPETNTDKNGKRPNRNATTAQIKHHWWWKANVVFNALSVQKYQGLVLLLEEDFYVLEDFIFSLKQMQIAANKFCNNCKILSLADNPDATNIGRAKITNANQVRITKKFSNMGIALNIKTWNEIVNCADSFCKYNDDNWDFSLQNVISTCLEDTDTMMLMFPRVVHIGACGVHVTSKNCDSTETILKIKDKFKEVKSLLFPRSLEKHSRNPYPVYSRPNGGWEDVRDHQLCRNMTTSTAKEL
ncbi:hypothetical protein RN001_000651 [Aquatica leii]|uniref:Alpha-1,6-mannosyl-glycoprotein 2-beta-N-acetylglucosaminyltransferase n=1 Tax=Aquatica leii TaxID=1421715 RepID=A0AAN7PAB8_9COLE|nr:hypothetical protein RN001_000651 [Aquatica leii]